MKTHYVASVLLFLFVMPFAWGGRTLADAERPQEPELSGIVFFVR